MPDAEYAKLLADLTRVASAYAKCRDLRQRLSAVLYPAIKKAEREAAGRSPA